MNTISGGIASSIGIGLSSVLTMGNGGSRNAGATAVDIAPATYGTTTSNTLSNVVVPKPSSCLVSSLLSMIPSMPYDAPATNVTIQNQDTVRSIEDLATRLEQDESSTKYTRNNAQKIQQLNGQWKLLYSNAPEITSLASNKLPLGFTLGKTYQPISINDSTHGYFENSCEIIQRQQPFNHLAKLRTRVIGNLSLPSTPNTRNAVGVVDKYNNRVVVEFQLITFELIELFGYSSRNRKSRVDGNDNVDVLFRKSVIPQVDPVKVKAPPANDITYLDNMVRIVRGGEGSLFIFQKEEQAVGNTNNYMLTTDERQALFDEATGGGGKSGGRSGGRDGTPKTTTTTSEIVTVGIGSVEESSNPEISFLFQERKTERTKVRKGKVKTNENNIVP